MFGKLAFVVHRVWHSPTANTWLSLGMRSISLVVVLPLVLRQFTTEEAAVWFVFSAVLAVQGILGFGFSPSFARLLSYARAGAQVDDMVDLRQHRSVTAREGVNWLSIDRLFSTMRQVFRGLAIASFLVLATAGTAAVWRSIAQTGHRTDVWLAWAVVVIGSSLSFLNLVYATFLQGMDHQVEWRRWEMMLAVGAIATSVIVLLAGGGLLALVVANQGWLVASLLAFRVLCRKLEPSRFDEIGRRNWDQVVFKVVWASAWKSGITNVMTYGLVQSTGIIQAQFGVPEEVVTYNLTLRIATVIGQVVQAPFNTKIPELARRRAIGDLAGQVTLIRRGLRLTHWSTVTATMLAAILMAYIFPLLQVRTFVFDPLLWALFGLNLIFERHGGMLHQVRNLTNQPMEHIGMGGYFVFMLTLMAVFYPFFGMYAYPAAMLGTQLLFAVWFNARIAYPVIGTSAWEFEKTVSLPPLMAQLSLCVYLAIYWVPYSH